jgi:hypothetical protein
MTGRVAAGMTLTLGRPTAMSNNVQVCVRAIREDHRDKHTPHTMRTDFGDYRICDRRTASLAVVLLAAVAAIGDAQVPRARGHHTIFYDEAAQRVMLTGGAANEGRRFELLNDLWSFDGARWTSHGASGERMSGARVATDARGRAYSFGAWSDSARGDVRLLEGDHWRTIGSHPNAVASEPGFVFHSARNRFVAFGGMNRQEQVLSEVWEFDGAAWTRHPAPSPPARGAHAMVYDSRRGKTVVFGGQGTRVQGVASRALGDTWEFDGDTWTRIQAAGPSPRLGAGAAYDSKRGLMILFGGADDQRQYNDLWSWNGSTWTKLAEGGPDPRVLGYIAYDRRRDRIVLFGGRRGYTDLGDTWEWDGSSWRRVGP